MGSFIRNSFGGLILGPAIYAPAVWCGKSGYAKVWQERSKEAGYPVAQRAPPQAPARSHVSLPSRSPPLGDMFHIADLAAAFQAYCIAGWNAAGDPGESAAWMFSKPSLGTM